MKLSIDTEIYVQGLYGNQWEDIEESFDEKEAHDIVIKLKNIRPDGKFRIVKKIHEHHLIGGNNV